MSPHLWSKEAREGAPQRHVLPQRSSSPGIEQDRDPVSTMVDNTCGHRGYGMQNCAQVQWRWTSSAGIVVALVLMISILPLADLK
jgi:hypothetical protein